MSYSRDITGFTVSDWQQFGFVGLDSSDLTYNFAKHIRDPVAESSI